MTCTPTCCNVGRTQARHYVRELSTPQARKNVDGHQRCMDGSGGRLRARCVRARSTPAAKPTATNGLDVQCRSECSTQQAHIHHVVASNQSEDPCTAFVCCRLCRCALSLSFLRLNCLAAVPCPIPTPVSPSLLNVTPDICPVGFLRPSTHSHTKTPPRCIRPRHLHSLPQWAAE